MKKAVHSQDLGKGQLDRAKQVRAYRPAALMLLVYVVLWIWRPNVAIDSIRAFGFSLKEVMLIMPGISILMGLFEVWVPKSLVEAHMGSGSGLKGFAIALPLELHRQGRSMVPSVARGPDKGAILAVTVFRCLGSGKIQANDGG